MAVSKTKQKKRNPRLTDVEFRRLLFQKLARGTKAAHIKTNFYELIRTKFAIEKGRALKLHTQYYEEWAKIKEQATNEQTAANTKETLKSALKSKSERQQSIENQIKDIEKRLSKGTYTQKKIVNGKTRTITRDLTPTEISKYHQTINQLNAELSKMAGDYAPTRTRLGGDPDSPPLTAELPVDLTKLSKAALKEVHALLKEQERPE